MLFNDLVLLFVDLGRLKSPLSDPELILKMIRRAKEVEPLHMQQLRAASTSRTLEEFKGFFKTFQEELNMIEDVAEKTKVVKVRMLDSLKKVEAILNSYRRNLERRQKKEPEAKQTLNGVESLLDDIRNLKKRIKEETEASVREEGKILRYI